MNTKLFIKLLSSSLLLLNSHVGFGQIIDNEQAHPFTKWRQIDTKNYRLLFPETFEFTARKLASQLPSLRKYSSQDLSISPRKITLVLQGNHLSQNGYVQLAPRKSEFFGVPSSTADNQEWLPNLALHELRHVAQFDKLTGRIRGPFFEQLALALYGLNLPAWYFEGDAVQIETVYSDGGRGRTPSWEMPLRANILAGENYSFNKYVLGSFKDNVPSYYTIGLFMNSYITNHFGLNSHEKIMEDMHAKLLRPFNFQQSVKHLTGMKPTKIYKETIQELAEKWTSERENNYIQNEIKTKSSNYPSDYLLPQVYSKNKLIALKVSPQSINSIMLLDTLGQEKEVVKTGIQITPYFHVKGDEIVWDEYRKDARFGKQTYNVITIFNIATKQLKTITKKSRYYSPAFHPTKNQLAVVEVDLTGRSSLVILDAEDGHVLDRINIGENIHIQQPKYNESGDKVICIAVSKKGTNLLSFDLPSQAQKLLLEWDNQEIDRPFFFGEDVLFKAHFDGIDNIYCLSANGRLSKVTNAQYGAFNGFISGKDLLYNDYQYNGYKLAKMDLLTDTTEKATQVRTAYIEPTAIQVSDRDSINLADSAVLVKHYNPNSHLLNFHSLSISSTNFESFDNYIPGLFWLSNDILNTTQVKLGYEYDPNISKSIYSAEVSYKRYLPVFTARYSNRGLVGNAVSSTQPDQTVMYDFRDHQATFEVSIPLSIYRQNTVYSYGTSFGTSYTKRYDLSVALRNFNETIAFPLNYQVYFNKNSMRSKMDLAPRWGQNFSVTYRHLPFEGQLNGQILSLRTNFYLPGVLMNHSLQLRFSAQKSNGRYEGTYDIPMVSGWGNFQSAIVKNTAMATYRMPLFYPDWSIGSLAYLKRFQGLLFSDFQNIDQSIAPKSFGIGISADFNVFRYILPDVNVAARLTYINDDSANRTVVPTFGLSYAY